MAKQTINIGTTANDGTGDPLRTAFDKVNSNFTELYNDDAGDVNSIIAGDGISVDTATGNVTVTNTITNNNQLTNGAGYVDGSGTANKLPKFTDSDTIGNSIVTDNGTGVGINNSNPTEILEVYKAADNSRLKMQNNAFASWVGNDATGFAIETNLFKPIVFKPSGVTAMTLDSSGNVIVNNNLSIGGTLIDSNSSAGTSGQILSSTGTGTDWVSLSEISGVDGSGTANYIPKWTDGNTIGNSIIYDNGTNVGIGTATPSQLLHVTDGSGGEIAIGTNTSAVKTLMFGVNNDYSIQSNGGSYLRIYTEGSERMRITSAGNLTIGGQTSTRLVTTLTENDKVDINSVDGTSTARNLTFSTGSTERMRITSGGFLKASSTGSYVGSTSSYHELRSESGNVTNIISNTNVNGDGEQIYLNSSDTTNYYLNGYSLSAGAHRFYIRSNGNMENINNSYGALSDIKVKENIVDASPKLDDLMQVKIRNYNLIGEESKQLGVVAQELEEVFPSMISEAKDFKQQEVPQLDENGQEVLDENGDVVMTTEKVDLGTTTKSVKYSVFVPMLIKAMQEQQVMINDLKAEIELLKTK